MTPMLRVLTRPMSMMATTTRPRMSTMVRMVVSGSVPAVALTGHDPARGIAENYREFARLEARGRSPHYEALAEAAADDPVVLRFAGSLPLEKHQPNLLFAAARYLLGAPAGIT